jgi:CBS domain-containing protein
MVVADLIRTRKGVYSIQEDMTVHDAARYLREKQIRAVGVRDQAGKLSGVISQSDISDKVAAENKCPAWMHVSDIMTKKLITVPPERTLEECFSLMEQHGFYHLLIVDATGEYRGMISIQDLLKVLAAEHKERADMLDEYIKH